MTFSVGDKIKHKMLGITGEIIRVVPQGPDFVYEVEVENKADIMGWASWNVLPVEQEGASATDAAEDNAAKKNEWHMCHAVRKVLFNSFYVACEICDKDMPYARI